ncbi:lipid-A-disaccharide synthase [Nisaea acidiphila]|uniref:Lipid-A-disaccharide synthase n=1 Tax=Nisaea acidiphila TaxID=1862145 RepID=A0A9J7ASP3_9PROT|nr:lipid-A-disaccharide synthase [Nisaea acidiphila]UUX50360.1 lipid-A-disaccharide synthase [Nisaea acidiphila]
MSAEVAETPLVYIVAGEASGDLLAAGMMRALKKVTGGKIRFAGVGGDLMRAEGLESLFPISEMAVMGVFEILPHAPKLLRRIKQTVADILEKQPDILVTVDSKAFSLRVQKRLYKRREAGGPVGFPLVHMVAPTVWAWRPGRAKVISRFLDRLLVLFPFERPYFEEHGLKTTFVGHPASTQPVGDGAGLRARTQIAPRAPVLGVLPGSRPGEVRRLLPVFGETVRRLIARYPDLRILVPTVSGVAEQVRETVKDWPGTAIVIEGEAEKYNAFDAMNVALAASGTVTLELALAGVPTAVGYKVSPLSAPIGRRLVNLEAVVLANRILGRPVQPFFLQENCTPDALTVSIARLFDDTRARADCAAAARELRELLGTGAVSPSETAALTVADAAGISPAETA